MGKIATAVAGMALVMAQVGAIAQDRPVAAAPVADPASSAGQVGSTDQAGPADQSTASASNGSGHHRLSPRDPRVIAAALAGLAILTLGIVLATDHHKHRPASP